MHVNLTGVTEQRRCELCGKLAELRPFGPNGECICFECGMKDPATTRSMFEKRMQQGAISPEDLGAVIRGMARRQ